MKLVHTCNYMLILAQDGRVFQSLPEGFGEFNKFKYGHHEKLSVAISARQSRVDKDMSLMDRLRMVSNFSWCPYFIP